jgi:anti-sigma regulatory factor (Ser/Thr protein kinase)
MAIGYGQQKDYEVEAYIDGEEINQFYKTLIEAKASAQKLKQEGATNIIIHDYTGKNPNGIRV